jgi:hypothetical protein
VSRVVIIRCDAKFCKTKVQVPYGTPIRHALPNWSIHGRDYCPACAGHNAIRLPRETFEDGLNRKYPGLIEQLGTMFDKALAHQYGLSKQRVSQIRQRLEIARYDHKPEWLSLLGTMSDAALARQTGKGTMTLRRWRRRLNIPVYRSPDDCVPEWVTAIRPRFGLVSDQKLADESGMSVMSVNRWRRKLGVSSYRQQRLVAKDEEAR